MGARIVSARAVRIAVAAAVLLAAAGAALIGIPNAIVLSASSAIVEVGELEAADAVMIPGALVYGPQSLSLTVRDRVDAALEVYRAGKARKILVSGDHGTVEYDEVNAIKRALLESGVPEADIFMDHAGFSTYESMYRARDVFLVRSLVVATQRFHLPRALFIAQELGLGAQGVAADRRAYANARSDALREALARVKDYFLAAWFKPLPTYLGPTIDISGDGRATQD
jgi:vancomycin permeability regulator SanA